MSVWLLVLFFFFSSPSVLYKHSPFTVVKQGTRIVMWSRRPCVKQERASDRPTQVTGSHECDSDVFISWNRINLTPKHYTQWEYVFVWVCVSSLVKELNFNISMGYSRHSWYTSRMKVHVGFVRVYHTDRMLSMRQKPPLSITKAHVSFSDTLAGMKKENPVSHN